MDWLVLGGATSFPSVVTALASLQLSARLPFTSIPRGDYEQLNVDSSEIPRGNTDSASTWCKQCSGVAGLSFASIDV